MIVSEIFEIKFDTDLTKKIIEDFFKKNNLDVVKWYIAKASEKSAKIFVSFQKKAL